MTSFFWSIPPLETFVRVHIWEKLVFRDPTYLKAANCVQKLVWDTFHHPCSFSCYVFCNQCGSSLFLRYNIYNSSCCKSQHFFSFTCNKQMNGVIFSVENLVNISFDSQHSYFDPITAFILTWCMNALIRGGKQGATGWGCCVFLVLLGKTILWLRNWILFSIILIVMYEWRSTLREQC